MPFVALRDFRTITKKFVPAIGGDYHDILIDLAAAQQMGSSLTMKQLVLLHGATATTVRRRVKYLMDLGLVVKLPNKSDARCDHFGVAECMWDQTAKIHSSLTRLHDEMAARRNNDRGTTVQSQLKNRLHE
jgi:DNA-binding MarR family transcriptional regulator